MLRAVRIAFAVALTLGAGAHRTVACVQPTTIPEQEPADDSCPGQLAGSCTLIHPAAVDDGFDWDYYRFSTTAGTPITVGTDDPGGAPFSNTIIELFASNCTTILASDGDSGPRNYSLIYQFVAPYTGDYNLRVHGVFTSHPQPYLAFIFCGDLPTGACCLPAGDCQLMDRVNCERQGGLFHGEGTACEVVACPEIPSNDRCADAVPIPSPGSGVLSGDTFFAHGDYDPWYPSCTGMPAGGRDVVYRLDLEPGDVVNLSYTQSRADASLYVVTDCADAGASCVAGADETGYGGNERLLYVASTPVPGACCFEDGSCRLLQEATCLEAGGIWRGAWTDCEPDYCYMLHGACCLPDGGCLDSDPWECARLGGDYIGDGTMCYWQPCPRPPGACCFEDGTCRLLSGQDCVLQGGFFFGVDTPCDPNPCTGPFGACCDPDQTCHVRTPAACEQMGGTYAGDYTRCETTTCGAPVGACCFANGYCIVLTHALCAEYLGQWIGGYGCDPNPCPASGPRPGTRSDPYYLILDTRVDDTGGPWVLEYSVTRPSAVSDGGVAAGPPLFIAGAPNPFTESTRILYRCDSAAAVRLEVFDAGGRAVRRLLDESRSDQGAIEWDGRDGGGTRVPAGVYFVRLTAGRLLASRAVIRLE